MPDDRVSFSMKRLRNSRRIRIAQTAANTREQDELQPLKGRVASRA
jgi:hypothetical protein